MITEDIRKQLRDFKRQGKDLKYCINYLVCLIKENDDEYDFQEVILVEMQNIGFKESDIFKCLENDFGFDTFWLYVFSNEQKAKATRE